MQPLLTDLKAFFKACGWYIQRKLTVFGIRFEGLKNLSVDLLMYKRGIVQKKLWHGSIIGLASVGVVTSGVFGGQTIVSSTYPGIGDPDPRFVTAFEQYPNGPILRDFQDTHTEISDKVRDTIIEHTVKSGETLSSIAKDYQISQDTIKWANNLTSEQIKPGQVLKILPVSGVAHTVKSGETLESIAKRYQAESQAILDYPFNDIGDDFSLVAGQNLIVPDGTPPETKAPVKPRPQPQYLAQGPSSPTFNAPGGASFIWPTNGVMTQYFSWYHRGIDVANRAAPAISASDGGTILYAGWDGTGYGNKVVIDHGNGYKTLYGHFSNIYVSVGQKVSRGQVIGQMGTTGRSTGTHLHFEVYYNGAAVNPLAILK